jgi:tryptophanyl-tRNA synthetase
MLRPITLPSRTFIAANTYLDAFDDNPDELDGLKAHYRRGGLGDMVLKRRLNDRLQALLAPIRTRRAEFAEQPDFVMEMVRAGTERAAALTQETLDQVRSALGLFSFVGNQARSR